MVVPLRLRIIDQ